MISHHHQSACIGVVAFAAGVFLAFAETSIANEVDGFTEPYKTVSVAAVETGTIKSIEVREGDVVTKGQVLARLDDEVHRALLAISQEGMDAQGLLQSAEAEVKMRRQRLEKLEVLRSQGHARQEEVERARTDMEIAEARLVSAKEQLEIKRLEHSKVQVQLNRRAVKAPIDGVVSLLHKDEGEFVAPNDPHVLEIVSLDPLMATFNVPSHLATRMKIDQDVSVYLEDAAKWVEGEVAVIAPVTDAESSTVRVKVSVPNAERKYRSGEHCTLQLKSIRTHPRRPARR